ncbi:hypothetical protein AB0I51_28430 [Streptomyces sp. NPDC050549]|uniref:hypothetical protein n=1 Tax=Streptomyces sp. NPDC050549 TaxID=3155406 RepID=UPI00342EE088
MTDDVLFLSGDPDRRTALPRRDDGHRTAGRHRRVPVVPRTVAGAGGFPPIRRELGPGAVRRSAAVVGTARRPRPDPPGRPWTPCVTDGAPGPDDPIPLGAVFTGRSSARTSPDGIVHQHGAGPGIQDAVAARAVTGAAQKERP